MAHHRSSGGENIRSRGVSRGVVAALLSILLVAAVVVTWQDLGDQIDRQAEEAAAQCVEGRESVPIVADPDIAPGVGTTVPGGATYREAHLIMELLHDSGLVRSLDIVELNPFLDERGRTARVAVELTGSLFGLQITDRQTPSNAVLPEMGE